MNAMLADRLRRARPDYGWLSEETPDSTAPPCRAACVHHRPDRRHPRLYRGRETVFPFAGDCRKRQGDCRGRISARTRPSVYGQHQKPRPARWPGDGGKPARGAEGATILTSRPNLEPGYWPGGVPDVTRSFRPSLAYRLCLVAQGRYDAMLTLREAWEWDIAAGSLIAERAGAMVTDRSGGPLRFNQPIPLAAGVVAAPALLHADFMRRLGV